MGVLFVATAAAVVALVLALHSAWSQRRGRAAAALRLQDERLLSARRRETAVARRRAALRTALPFPFGYLNRRLKQGAIAMSVQTVVVLAAIGAVVCWAGAAMVLGNGWISRAALLGGLWAPVIWVERQAERRREAIATEMERVTAALEGAVSAGMNAYEALVEVGVSTGGILGPELLRVVEDADRLGMSEALVLLGQRLPLPEVQLLVAGMRLNQGAGAHLSDSLAGLGRTLRERRETQAAMMSATASGRWQANMLIAVPPVLLLFMRWVYPAFEAPLFGTASGQFLLLLSSFWLLVGYFVVKKMAVPKEMV